MDKKTPAGGGEISATKRSLTYYQEVEQSLMTITHNLIATS